MLPEEYQWVQSSSLRIRSGHGKIHGLRGQVSGSHNKERNPSLCSIKHVMSFQMCCSDYQCGVLHCEMNNEKLEYGYESAAILASFFVNARNKIHACRSVVVDFGLADTSPGMVPDGAPCGEGDGRMCVGQKCQEVPPIPPSCQDCSGRGKCNSKGNCHCDDGYGGKFCEGPGLGGSPDSGPALYRGTSKILKALKVTIFGFIPLIGIITFYLYYGNGSLKRICLEIRTNGLAAVANPP